MPAKGTYSTTVRKHGHTIRFDGGKGYHYIDVSYDGNAPIDVVNCYDYATGRSEQTDRAAFLRDVREYVADLTKHDADNFAEASRYYRIGG